MTRRAICFATFFALALCCGTLWGQGYAGTYRAQGPDGGLTLALSEEEGRVTGSLEGPGLTLELEGRVLAEGIGGTVAGSGGELFFAAQLCEDADHLFLALGPVDDAGRIRQRDATELTLERTSAPLAAAPPAESGVVINGVRLSVETVAELERRYGVPIVDGDYWYDRLSGAWGYAGGPTVGYVVPGLAVGGELRADASNGTTPVFVNGRRLHLTEVLAIRQLVGVVYPGRYWFDAQGNYGFEGFPAIGNLWAIARRAGGQQKEGILSSWDKTGVSVIGGDVLIRD